MLNWCNPTYNMGHLAQQAFYAMHAHYHAAIDYRDRIDEDGEPPGEEPNEVPPHNPEEVPPMNPKPPFEVPVPEQPNEVPPEQPNELPQPGDK